MVGGTSGIGRELAARRAAGGDDVVITGRDPERTAKVAAEIGDHVRGVAVELAAPPPSVRRWPVSSGSTTWSSRRSTATRTPPPGTTP